MVTFGIHYVIEDGSLTPENVFAGLALFNQLTVPLFIFPVTVPIIISAVVSTRRIEEFLSLTEIKRTVVPANLIDDPAKEIADRNKYQKIPKQMIFGLKHIEEDEEQQTETEHWMEMKKYPDQILEDALYQQKDNIVEILNAKFSWNGNDKPTLDLPNLTIPKRKFSFGLFEGENVPHRPALARSVEERIGS